jgi:hypothetical protein
VGVYLYYPRACACCGYCGGSADVECVVSVATSADNVDDEVLVRIGDDRWDRSRVNGIDGSKKDIFSKL